VTIFSASLWITPNRNYSSGLNLCLFDFTLSLVLEWERYGPWLNLDVGVARVILGTRGVRLQVAKRSRGWFPWIRPWVYRTVYVRGTFVGAQG